MPETANQNDCYQVRIVGRIEGQETNNVLHFRYLSGASDTDVATHLILVAIQCFINHLLPVLSNAWTLERVIWKRVSPTLGPEIISIPVGAGAGGNMSGSEPSFVSAVVSLRTREGGRRKRGRMYIPGVPESAVTGSSIETDDEVWQGLLDFCLCMIAAFVPGDPVGANQWGWSVYSRANGGATFPYGLAGFTQITEAVPVQLLGTTRSRKVGRGA